MIRNLIWDMDGTLFDTYPAISQAFQNALVTLSANAPLEHIDALARVSLEHCAITLADENLLDPDLVMQAFGQAYAAMPPASQPPFPGVRETCEHVLKAGGCNAIVTHRRRGSLLRFLDHYQMGMLFRDWTCGDDSFPRKPDPAAFNYLIARHTLDPAETLAIGDREIDLQAGAAAGLRTCLFSAQPGELRADFIVSNYPSLLDILQKEQ
jgi:HAD superfamily hydrolase (TIGR01509 family)